jgi:hypothetical protein
MGGVWTAEWNSPSQRAPPCSKKEGVNAGDLKEGIKRENERDRESVIFILHRMERES